MFWTTLWEKELPQKKRNCNLALYAIFTQMEAIPGDSGQVSIKGLRWGSISLSTAAPLLVSSSAGSRPPMLWAGWSLLSLQGGHSSLCRADTRASSWTRWRRESEPKGRSSAFLSALFSWHPDRLYTPFSVESSGKAFSVVWREVLLERHVKPRVPRLNLTWLYPKGSPFGKPLCRLYGHCDGGAVD